MIVDYDLNFLRDATNFVDSRLSRLEGEATTCPDFRVSARDRSCLSRRSSRDLSTFSTTGRCPCLAARKALRSSSSFKAELSQRKPSTVQREFNTLKAILNDAIRAGQIKKNPCDNADKIPPAPPRQRFLDAEEVVRLLTKAEETADWLPDFILWCLHSGMRRGEVLQLLWSDVRKLPNARQIIQVQKSKNDQPRIVVCTATMIEILERQKNRKKDDNEQVFPIARMTLRRKWEAARREAGLEDVTIHDLRRTHSTQAAVAGVDLRTLAGRLGHANLSMLEKHYAALVGSASEEAADKIEKAFSAKP